MLVDVVIEQRFFQCSAGHYWTENAFPHAFWTRYLTTFSTVNVVARVQQIDQAKSTWHRVDGPGVTFTNLPYYLGPVDFLKNLGALYRALRQRRGVKRRVIYRIPGILALLYHQVALDPGMHYGAEVVGDPMDTFSPGASKNPLRVFFKWLFVNMLKRQCKQATSIAYVTEFSLQKRYPPAKHAFHTYYSSIQLTSEDFATRNSYTVATPIKIVCIGNLAQPYKGCDFMLSAVANLRQQGVDVSLRWIGGGALLPQMEDMVADLGISDSVTFVGNLSGREKIRQELDNADLFVLSSRQEGLPRVVIEAMARSLVCIATDVGGVRELLTDDHVIERDNIAQLTDKVMHIARASEAELLQQSIRNHSKAQQYSNTLLSERRQNMYQALLAESV